MYEIIGHFMTIALMIITVDIPPDMAPSSAGMTNCTTQEICFFLESFSNLDISQAQ